MSNSSATMCSRSTMQDQGLAHASIHTEKRLPTAIAYLLCAVLLLVSLASVGTIIAQANHEHDHAGLNGSCAACLQLAVAAQNLTQSASGSAFVLAIICVGTAFVYQMTCGLRRGSQTPFMLKVRLNI